MDNFLKLIELVKLPLVYISAFLLTTSCVIFLPDQFLVDLGVKSIRDDYRSYIGITFIFSASVLIVNMTLFIYKKIVKKINQYNWEKEKKFVLKNLSIAEKSILKKMMINGTNSLALDYSNGEHKRLEHYEIIYRASNMSMIGKHFSYSLQPWAIIYLSKNASLLD